MADLNNTIVRGKLRVTDEIVGPLNITNLSTGNNGQFLSVSNNVPTWVDQTISGTVTKEIGGIPKDKTYANADIISVLNDLLFPYVAPKMSSITLSDAAGTYEYGTAKTVSKVTPNFTKGSKNIISIKIDTSSGGDNLYSWSGTSATSGTTITLTTSKTYDGLTIGSNKIYCTISDGTQSASANATISFAYYPYAYTSSSTNVSSITSGAQKATNTSIDTEFNLTLNEERYIWILLPPGNSGTKTIQYYSLGDWYDFGRDGAESGTADPVDVSLKLNSGQAVTYKGYRTKKKAAIGTTSFRIK